MRQVRIRCVAPLPVPAGRRAPRSPLCPLGMRRLPMWRRRCRITIPTRAPTPNASRGLDRRVPSLNGTQSANGESLRDNSPGSGQRDHAEHHQQSAILPLGLARPTLRWRWPPTCGALAHRRECSYRSPANAKQGSLIWELSASRCDGRTLSMSSPADPVSRRYRNPVDARGYLSRDRHPGRPLGSSPGSRLSCGLRRSLGTHFPAGLHASPAPWTRGRETC